MSLVALGNLRSTGRAELCRRWRSHSGGFQQTECQCELGGCGGGALLGGTAICLRTICFEASLRAAQRRSKSSFVRRLSTTCNWIERT